jgi:putative acyl-CoA dehydrogenase
MPLMPFETHEVLNQSPPFENVNLFTSDAALMEAAKREGAATAANRLKDLGARAGSAEGFEIGRLANEHPPRLRRFDPKGFPLDTIEFHPAYHAAMEMSMKEGLHSSVWEHLNDGKGQKPKAGANVARAAGSYIMCQMEAGHCCPITMTNAAVPTLLLQPDIAQVWLTKILSRAYDRRFLPMADKSAVTIGMGMTEKQGGTDVRSNTTHAAPVGVAGPGQEYVLVGHKWFMSAPMCDAFLVLAQAHKGLSCFLVPRFLPDGRVNNLRFQRLKEKLGNRSNASSEVELAAAHGWLVGEEGRGVPVIIEMVTHTRLDCAVSSAGLMRLAFANALHHCRHRAVFQKMLADQPLMAEVLADMALDVEASTALAFRLARAFDKAATDPREAAFRRLMTPVVKYWVCKQAPGLAYEAMECLGGNGYVEDGIAARLYREVPVNAIWEGSGNVMGLDVLRVLLREGETAGIVMEMLEDEAKGDKRLEAHGERVRRLLTEARDLDRRARALLEGLALAAAGAILRRHAPSVIADAFIGTRLEAGQRAGYGAGVRGADTAAILARALPV